MSKAIVRPSAVRTSPLALTVDALVLFQMFAGPRLPFDDTAPAGRVPATPPASRIRRGILARENGQNCRHEILQQAPDILRLALFRRHLEGGIGRPDGSRKLTAVSLSHSCRRA